MKKLLILFVLLFCLTSESCKENTSVTAHGTEKGYLVVKKDKLSFGQINRIQIKTLNVLSNLQTKGTNLLQYTKLMFRADVYLLKFHQILYYHKKKLC